MVKVEKKEKRNQGDHLPPGAVQADIIKYVLSKINDVPEPDIRRYLKDKHGIRDKKNIKRHLNLLKTNGCIEIVSKGGGEDENIWDITNVENLKNVNERVKEEKIKEKGCYKEIDLKKYEKTLNVILKESGSDIKYLVGLRFYIQLSLSQSFIDVCIEKGIKSLYSGAWENHKDGYGYKRDQLINNNLEECYDLHILDNPNVKMSMEKFKKVIEETFLSNYENFFPGCLSGITNETVNQIIVFNEDKGETTLRRRKEFLEETLKVCVEKLPGLPNVQFSITAGRLDMLSNSSLGYLLADTISQMRAQIFDFVTTWFDVLFMHFLNHDRLTGVASDEEINFAKKINLNMVKYLKSNLSEDPNYRNSDDKYIKRLLDDITIMSEIIFTKRHPLFFCENCNTSLEVHERLINFFDKLLY